MSSVGEILAAERRRQGKSVTDVVNGTHIRSRLVDALENGRYDELPSVAYVKGYIQSYARFLDIPDDPLLSQFRREYGEHSKAASPSDRFLGMTTAELKRVPADTVVPRREQAHAIPPQVWAAVAGGVVVLLLLICGIGRSCSAAQNTSMPQPAGTSTAGEVTASPGESPAVEPTTTVSPLDATFKLRVSVRPGQASWIHVTADGLEAFDGTLGDGDSREWLVTEKAVVRVGRPSVVQVTRDGKTVRLKEVNGVGVVTLVPEP